MPAHEIMLALTNGKSPALGNIWRITAKKTDFYLDFLGELGAGIHLSVHGPNDHFTQHRFHVKADARAVSTARRKGHFVEHRLPRKGFSFDGVQLSESAFLVARIRWSWHLQRPRYRSAAVSVQAPRIKENQSGRVVESELKPNEAWDVDIIVSYNEPFWPHPHQSLRDNARLGPLKSSSGLWLTATSYISWQAARPTPESLSLDMPGRGEEPTRIACCGPGANYTDDFYWFVETITARNNLRV